MKCGPLNKLIQTSCIALIFCGCSTQTRLTYLIPANQNSQSASKEIVRVDVVDETTPGIAPLLAMAVPALTDLAIDAIKGQLQKEADSYQAQFHVRKQFKTSDFGDKHNVYLILSRWVDRRAGYLGDYTPPLGANDLRTNLVEAIKNDLDKPINSPIASKFLDALNKPKAKEIEKQLLDKNLAFVYIARVTRVTDPGDQTVFSLTPEFLWEWQTKAKVVGFNFKEAWKPWQLIGTLIFKTDGKVHVKVQTTITALSTATNKSIGPQNMTPSSPALIERDVDLNAKQKAQWLEAGGGSWFAVPSIATDNAGKERVGFFDVQLDVTESDASNAKQLILKGTTELDKAKTSLQKAAGN